MRAATRVPGAAVVRGLHGTTAPGAVGILRSGYVREQLFWKLVFFHGIAAPRHDRDVYELVGRRRNLPVFSSGLAFEIECQWRVKVLTGGGHADERAACLTAGGGVCQYKCQDQRRRRWTALESHAQVVALWILPGARGLDELGQYIPFTM